MASRKPLVVVNGSIQELPAGDTLAGGKSLRPDAAINGMILATDQLIDATVGGAPIGNGQAYFHQVVADQTISVVGMTFRITRSGSVSSGWVGLFSITGTLLAVGPCGNDFLGSEGWKKPLFNAAYTLQAGTRYVLGIVASGDNIPGFLGTNNSNDYNQGIAAMPLRSFRKTSVSTLNANQDFTQNTFANTDQRPYLSLVAS